MKTPDKIIREFCALETNQDTIVSMVEQDDNTGLCVYCGEEAYCVEPDARNYPCESCSKTGVFGAQELLFYFA